MLRYCILLASGLLWLAPAGPATAADNKSLVIRWHGQSFFEIITTAGTRIVIDPHNIEQYGRKTVQADLVLVSHPHTDHATFDAVENIKKAKVLHAVVEDKNDRRRTDWNILDEKFKDVRVQTIGCYHDNMSGLQRGKNGAFILEVDGLRIVHLGDLGHSLSEAQVKKIGQVDILMIPVGGVYTLNSLTAAKVQEQLAPRRYVLPMHYGTPVYDYLLPVTGFLDEQNKEMVKKLPGNELVVDPKAPVAKEPTIVTLHYRGKAEP
jgi:L-ascorbate metabolism protein UlaG (beta-lactamase superfamily)